jgi:hypothetical protein
LKGNLLYVFFLFQKLKRRKVMIEKKSGWSKEKKTKVHQFLQLPEAHKYMSSDEEVDNGFLSHPYSWESEEWRKIKDSLDKKFLETYALHAASGCWLKEQVAPSKTKSHPMLTQLIRGF